MSLGDAVSLSPKTNALPADAMSKENLVSTCRNHTAEDFLPEEWFATDKSDANAVSKASPAILNSPKEMPIDLATETSVDASLDTFSDAHKATLMSKTESDDPTPETPLDDMERRVVAKVLFELAVKAALSRRSRSTSDDLEVKRQAIHDALKACRAKKKTIVLQ